MRYEFIHDSIAKQVFYKAGAEARTRRKVEKYIREHYEQYEERGAELTEDDIDYVTPYLGLVNISDREARFIAEGKARLNRKRLRRRALVLATIAILFAAMVFSLISRYNALESAEESRIARDNAEKARLEVVTAKTKTDAALKRADSLALSLRISLADAQRARNRAERAQREAERRSNEAQSLALAVHARTIRKEQPIVSLQLAKAAYGKLPKAPLPTVAQTLGSLFYDQFSYRNEPGAPLFESTMQAPGHSLSPAWSPGSKYFLAFAESNALGLYRASGSLITTLPHDFPITARSWSPDGTLLATGDKSGTIKTWTPGGEARNEYRIGDWVAELRFSPDNQYLYAWSTIAALPHPPGFRLPTDDSLHIWDSGGQPIASVRLPTQILLTLDFSPDGRTLLLRGTGGIALADPRGQLQWSPAKQLGLVQRLDYNGRSNRFLARDIRRRFFVYEFGRPEAIAGWDGAAQPIRDVRLSPDGTTVLVHSGNDRLILRDVETGDSLYSYPALDVRHFSFSPGGQHVLTRTGAVHTLWRDRTDPLPLTQLPHSDFKPVFGPSDRHLVIKNQEDRLLLWQADKPEQVLPLAQVHRKPVHSVTFDSTGNWLLTREVGSRAFLWTPAGKLVSRFDKHSSDLTDAAFSPDGMALLTTDRSGRANLWCIDQTVLAQTFGRNSEGIATIFSLPKTEYVLARYRDYSYFLHAPEHGIRRKLLPPTAGPVKETISPDGRWIALQAPDRLLQVWDTSGRPVDPHLPPGLGTLSDLAFTRDSSYFLGLDLAGALHLWSIHGNTPLRVATEASGARTLRLSPPGDRILINGGGRRAVSSEDTTTQPALAAFSPQGGYWIADGAALPPILFRLRETNPAGPRLRQIALPVKPMEKSTERIDIWTRDGELRRSILIRKGDVPRQVAFAPDGAVFAIRFFGRKSQLYDSLGNYLSLLNARLRRPEQVVFSPDNRYLLATYGDYNVRVFDRQGTLIVLLNQHQDTVTQATFAPHGGAILTVAGSVAKLFSPQGQLLAEFDRHDGPILSADFTPDGLFVITLDSEGTVRRYPLPSRIYAWLNGEGRLPKISAEELQRFGLTEYNLAKGDQ